MDELSRLIRAKNNIRFCSECGTQMGYSAVHGIFTCKNCGAAYKDIYGHMKELLEETPTLSLAEMSMILNVPLRQLRQYVRNGILENPNMDQEP
ncbi:MAG: hypothetical protein IJ679_04945 [Lachnospiraceae bacterium]|nr:hypothetical protein [Lachnospiraceae bacterium]